MNKEEKAATEGLLQRVRVAVLGSFDWFAWRRLKGRLLGEYYEYSMAYSLELLQ